MALTRAHFRIILMQCCGTMLCWVNPRLPNYCPECGKFIFAEVKGWVPYSDEQAYITHKEEG